MKKLKCYLAICEEYPKGLVFSQLNSSNPRQDAMDLTKECRSENCKAYVRVRYFTEQELLDLPEAD